MRPSKTLVKIESAALNQLARIESRVLSCSVPPRPEDERIIALAMIDTHNLWTSFSRHYYLSCAIGTRSRRGVKITPANGPFVHVGLAIDFAVTTLKPWLKRPKTGAWNPLQEPAWYKPKTLLQLANRSAMPHEPDIITAFSLQSRVFEDAPVVRNFFAHRGQGTAETVSTLPLAYQLPSSLRPAIFLGSQSPGRVRSVLAEWIINYRQVISRLC